MTQSIGGLVSGLDTATIVQQLVAIEQQRVDLVSARKDKASLGLNTWTGITTQTAALKLAASALQHPTDWTPLTGTSSNEAVASVSAGSGTLNGSLQFTVDSLASAGAVRSANVLTSTGTTVAADQAILVAAGGAAVGFASFASDNALALGVHTINVTQGSSAAVKLGNTPLNASTTIAGGDTITFSVNGAAYTLDNITPGTYTPANLASAIQTAATAKGAPVNVTVDPQTNALRIASSREGSAATLQITGGTALAALNMSVDATNKVGTDGKVQVDSAAEQTFTQIDPGQSVVLNAAAGTINATFSGGLRAGTLTANNVSVGDGSLSTVVANINAAQAGATATAVQVSLNSYRLQINSNSTGASSGPNIAASEFNSAVGSLVELSAASDAQITVGTGIGAYQVTSQNNTVSGVLPGVTLQLKSVSATPVTVTVNRDVSGLAAKVQALVDAANKVQAAVATATHYNVDTKTASPLTGNPTATRLMSEITKALTDAVPFGNPGSPGLAGVSIDKTGKYTFDQGKFTTAFNADPSGVIRAFTQGGTSANPGVSFSFAGDRARAGAYDVTVTALATQAASTGLNGAWPAAGGNSVKARIGTKEVTYAIQAGDTQSSVVAALNTRFSQSGLQLSASVDTTGIRVQSTQFGHVANFDVAWDGATYANFAGTDVQGTIGGKAAIGTGQQLAIPFDDATMGGLSLNITATTIGSLGNFTYNPGVGQRVATAMSMATDSVDGFITSTQTSLKSNMTFIDTQVADMQAHLVAYQAQLKAQFSTLETTLSNLKAQANWIGTTSLPNTTTA
ncbi:MAG: flagellar hook-associated 2 domain protein [Actinomycetia bacterium]|nr:flagellar hook-associated 2 domain protein [Actinomycetes bacterium]